MSTVKSAGSSSTVSPPWGRGDAAFPASRAGPPPQALSDSTPSDARARVLPMAGSAQAFTSAARVGLAADDGEVLVELDVGLAPVGLGHLDLVVALLVVDLGPGDPAAPGRGEGGVAGLLQRVAADRDVRTFLGAGIRVAVGRGDAGATAHDGRGTDCDGELPAVLHGDPPRDGNDVSATRVARRPDGTLTRSATCQDRRRS